LFVIIVLGESLLVTGTTFGEIEASKVTVSAFVVAFLGRVALWLIYFSRGTEAASGIISSSEDPGRLARSAYTYFHIPLIAGIIAFAAADELTVAHPGDPGTPASVALILGGTALFLAGHAFFKWAVFGVLSFSHMVAIAVLAVLVPVGFAIPTLALSGAACLIVVGLAVWDILAHGGGVGSPRRPPRECGLFTAIEFRWFFALDVCCASVCRPNPGGHLLAGVSPVLRPSLRSRSFRISALRRSRRRGGRDPLLCTAPLRS
jgi:hypothetical protein